MPRCSTRFGGSRRRCSTNLPRRRSASREDREPGSRFRTLPRCSPISSHGLGRWLRWRTSGSIRSVTCPVSSSRASRAPGPRTGTRTGRTGANRRAPDPLPVKVFLMYYLVDTSPVNGCLRVIPRSHRHRFPQHEYEGHGTDIRYEDPDTSITYADAAGQIDVPIMAGDLLIGDSRVLHAPRANRADERRTVLTMWYLPRWTNSPSECAPPIRPTTEHPPRRCRRRRSSVCSRCCRATPGAPSRRC